MSDYTFIEPDAAHAAKTFMDKGYILQPVEDMQALNAIRACAAEHAAVALGRGIPEDIDAFLNGFHEYISVDELNGVRLSVIEALNRQTWLRPAYFALARNAIYSIVGNELAMQRRVNLSIQLPDDQSSILPVHADVWSGDSPFEIVLWVPLVDCHDTKSMYLTPPGPDRKIQNNMSSDFKGSSEEDLFAAIENDVEWMNVPYGHVLVFSQTLMHGNRVNEEPETRWSMNCRFKSLFSPYADKRLGEFFEPITMRAVTEMALDYNLPQGFGDE
ncbi:hypothetical protein L2D14_02580 [Thalassospiraceae bacterium LMO-JJ14]|nr:hypothetical protein L2D14_02580 [Thalassospiraceae bacterium LMO-JJ14]